MGDPKFPHKTYSTPRHPWEKDRIDTEKELLKKFGLKNKRELWKGMELLKSFRSQARDLQARMRVNDLNADKQFQALIRRLSRYSILGHDATLDDVLSLSIDDILARRLQTIVFRKNLSRTMKQARQMITHGHVIMDGRRVTVPGMLVEGQLEESIVYHDTSPFTDDLHPIRRVILNGPGGQEEEPEEVPADEEKGTADTPQENVQESHEGQAKERGGEPPKEKAKEQSREKPREQTRGKPRDQTREKPKERAKAKGKEGEK